MTNKPDAPLSAETFEFTLADGSTAVVGKPRGVLKLKLRDILTADELKDLEIVGIATALLSIRSIGGLPIILRAHSDFQFLMERFGSDAALDEFMTKYTKLTNPAVADIIEKTMDYAMEERLSPEDMQELVKRKLMEHEAEQRKKVKNL